PAAPNATGSQPFGYERFELNFGKQIPQFKTYNSMMPLWRQLDRNTGDAIHLQALYSAVSDARRASPALRSKEGWFLRLKRNPPPADEEGWATTPYEAQYPRLIDTTSKNECGTAAYGGVMPKHPVLTRSYDNNRTGANTNEQSFTPSAIKTRGLRRVFSLKVEGDDPNIEAQPLYVPDVEMSDGTRHDVVYLFSMSDNVRAFDDNPGAQFWPHP